MIGAAGAEALRNLLNGSENPRNDINEFREANSIQLQSLPPALRFLDMQGVRRSTFHFAVLEELQKKLQSAIQHLSPSKPDDLAKLETLLRQSFKYVEIESIKPIVHSLLRIIPAIPDDITKQVVADRSLYGEIPMEAKRQIWNCPEYKELYLKELSVHIENYLDAKAQSLDFLSETPKGRLRAQQQGAVKGILGMIGDNVSLYDHFLQLIRMEFTDSGTWALCTLRAEVLMSLHEQDVIPLLKLDPCHKFAWCIDACTRERVFDQRQAKELKTILDTNSKKEYILADLSMVGGDPHALHFFASLAIKLLHQCIGEDQLPRDHANLQLAMRIMHIGLSSHSMFEKEEFKEDHLDSIVYSKFLPLLTSVMAYDELARNLEVESRKSTKNELFEASPDSSMSQEVVKETESALKESKAYLSPDLTIFLKTHAVCVLMLWQYLIELLTKKDFPAASRILSILPKSEKSLVWYPEHLNIFVTVLATHGSESFALEDLSLTTSVFDKFLLLRLDNKNVKRVCMHLLSTLSSKIPYAKFAKLLQSLNPTESDDSRYKFVHQNCLKSD